jgi:pSer/pThr/pTyr-binding forkhead associated (FHA) protein
MYDNEPTMMGRGRPTATLVIRQGTQAGMSFVISGSQAIIGREEGLDIVLQDPESSRRHSRISWQGGRYIVEDLGSTNGTFVNGLQITTPRPLNPGDSIMIGQTTLVFQEFGAAAYQQATPQAAEPVYIQAAPPPATNRGNQATQYLLYGCGCLLLMCICGLLMLTAWVLVSPDTFEKATGIGVSLNTLQFFLNLA